MAILHTGTSGWAYPSWKPAFYPAKLPQKSFLNYYATRLNAVEVNYTFRHYASEKTQQGWCASTPDGFRFSVKAHQRITHIKKLRDAGALGPDRVMGVFGIGGLGGYAVQYAKILGAGAKIVALARNPDKLAVAKEYGADYIINIKGKTSGDIAKELSQATGRNDIDAAIDCAGAPEMVQLAMSLLSISGHYADVGLVGDRIDIPLFPRVSREQTLHGSYWGNNTDLTEVMALAARGKIRHTVKTIRFDQLNEYIDLLRAGEIVGRAVMTF